MGIILSFSSTGMPCGCQTIGWEKAIAGKIIMNTKILIFLLKYSTGAPYSNLKSARFIVKYLLQ
jgi:hypothetical protein